jgi:hypothetical protein
VCTQGGKIGNLEKIGGYLQKIFLQGGIAKHTNFAGGYWPIYPLLYSISKEIVDK